MRTANHDHQSFGGIDEKSHIYSEYVESRMEEGLRLNAIDGTSVILFLLQEFLPSRLSSLATRRLAQDEAGCAWFAGSSHESQELRR